MRVPGKLLTSFPIGSGVDFAAFDPKSNLAFFSCVDGNLNIFHEKSATEIEDWVRDMKVRDIGFIFLWHFFLASRYAKKRRTHHDRLFASIGSQTD